MTALDITRLRRPTARSDRNAISAPCWDGRHRRCSGWLVVPDTSRGDRRYKTDRSIRCECAACNHPPVDPGRHLHEQPQRPAYAETRPTGGA